jgi:hypothetical protein
MSKLPIAAVAWAVVLVQSLAITPASAALQRRSSSRPPTRSIKIAVLAKEGSKESRARNMVIRALRANRVQIASTRETASAKAAYQQGDLSDKDVMSLSEQYGIAAFALVQVSGRKSVNVTVTIRNGEDGTVLDEAHWSKLSPSRLKSVEQTVWKTLGTHIAKAKVHQTSREPTPPPPPPVAETTPPPEPPKEPDPTPVVPPTPPAVAESPAAPTSTAARSPGPTTTQVATVTPSEAVDPQRLTLDLAIGAGAFSRDFSYSADATALGSSKMNVGQMVSGTLQWYPLAPATSSAVGWIGLIGSGDYGVGLKSSTPNGPSLRTTSYRYSGGLKFRVPIGNSELGLSGSYGRATFSIKDQNPPPGSTAIPDVAYQFIQPELSARVGIFRTFWLVAGASYLHTLKSGQIASSAFFPHATAMGFGGSFGFAWEVASSLELRVIAEYERVSLTMNSQATDPLRAQGASDQYLLGRGTFAYRWK